MTVTNIPSHIVHGEWLYTFSGTLTGQDGQELIRWTREHCAGEGRGCDYVLSAVPNPVQQWELHEYVDPFDVPKPQQPDAPVPEPGTLALLVTAMALALLFGKKGSGDPLWR